MNHAPLTSSPEWPAFLCVDGWAWHPNVDLRQFYTGNVLAHAQTLASVYEGPAVDRVLALRALLLEVPSQTRLLQRVFPAVPGMSERRAAQLRGLWRRAAMAIHDDVVDLIREAQPRFYQLQSVNLMHPREHKSSVYRCMVANGIPVRDPTWDRRHPPADEATRVAQIFWAQEILIKHKGPIQ